MVAVRASREGPILTFLIEVPSSDKDQYQKEKPSKEHAKEPKSTFIFAHSVLQIVGPLAAGARASAGALGAPHVAKRAARAVEVVAALAAGARPEVSAGLAPHPAVVAQQLLFSRRCGRRLPVSK